MTKMTAQKLWKPSQVGKSSFAENSRAQPAAFEKNYVVAYMQFEIYVMSVVH